MKAPGSVFLLVTGIIYVVNNIGFVVIGIAVAMLAASGGFLRGGLIIGFAIMLLGSFELIVGTMGISHRNNPKKSGTLLALGIISLIGSLLNFLLSFFSALVLSILALLIPFLGVFAAFAFSPFATFVFIAVPIFYIVGAYKNREGRILKNRERDAAIPRPAAQYGEHWHTIRELLLGPPLSLYVRWAASQTEAPAATFVDLGVPVTSGSTLVAPEVTLVAPEACAEQGLFSIRIGLFKEPANAETYLKALRSSGFSPASQQLNSPRHGEVIRVFIPDIKAAERQEVVRRLATAGFKGTWARG